MNTSLYLKKLKFDPSLKNSLFAKYLTNFRLVTLVILAVVAIGLQAYLTLPRKLNPTINIPLVIVSTVLPGGSPSDIESLVSVPIEDAVSGIDDVKQVTSTSRDSVSIVTIEFESGTDPEKAKSDVDSAVNGITDLPEDALDPNINKLDFENQPIWTFNLFSESPDKSSLIRFARNLKNDLEELPSIDRVEITGIDEQEIQIVLKPEVISSYQLNPLQLSGLIKNSLSSFPAGTVKTENSIFSLTIDQNATTIDDIRNIKVTTGNGVLSLGDIAVVREISKPDQNQSFVLADGKVSPSVSFNVFRITTTNIEDAAHDAEELVEEKLLSEGRNFEVKTVVNTAEILSDEFSVLTRDVLLTVSLVFLVLLVFLGIRQAAISMLSVPFTFLITFFVMQWANIEFSFLATFSLLLSLGLLVDDTIVVISAMTSYYRTKKFTPLETALLVFRDFRVAILTTTITTVWAFIPLILGTGIIGEFIKPIPIVVSSALLGSLVVAFLITIPLMVFLLKPLIPFRVKILLVVLLFIGVIYFLFVVVLPQSNLVLLQILAFIFLAFITIKLWGTLYPEFKRRSRVSKLSNLNVGKTLSEGLLNFRTVESRYHTVLERILSSKKARRNTVIFVVLFSLFAFLLVPLGVVKNEFFPKTDEDNLYISIEYPSGTNPETTERLGTQFLKRLNISDADFITLETGRSFSSEMGPGGGSGNTALYSIALKKDRILTMPEIAEELRQKYANYNTGKLSVVEVTGGPPAGADLQIKLFGPDLSVLDAYAERIQEYLSTQNGVTNIDKTIKPGTSKLVFVPDSVKLASNNVTVDQVGLWLRIFASGFEADTLKIPGETDLTEDITLRLSTTSQTIEDISRIAIPTQTGPSVPLTLLGNLKLKSNPTLISREDGKRTLSVTATVTSGFNVAELNSGLEKYADSLNLPTGYGWATGGVNEENQQSVNSILQAMIYSFLLIIATLVLQFSSFRRALIVMLVIPLSITGVFIIFALTGTPLSFPALIGILALFGIVVKNSILVVDKILTNQKTGMGFKDSIIEASTSRLEPIALTSIATIVGLIPITLSDPLWRGLGGSIIAGLFFSGTIMLFFIPVVYYYIYQNEGTKKPLR